MPHTPQLSLYVIIHTLTWLNLLEGLAQVKCSTRNTQICYVHDTGHLFMQSKKRHNWTFKIEFEEQKASYEWSAVDYFDLREGCHNFASWEHNHHDKSMKRKCQSQVSIAETFTFSSDILQIKRTTCMSLKWYKWGKIHEHEYGRNHVASSYEMSPYCKKILHRTLRTHEEGEISGHLFHESTSKTISHFMRHLANWKHPLNDIANA